MDPPAAGFSTAVISKHNGGGGVRAAFSSASLAGETMARPWMDRDAVVVVVCDVVVACVQVDCGWLFAVRACVRACGLLSISLASS